MQVCEAVLRNEPTILTISAKPTGEYGVWDVYMTLPCVVSRRGVDRIVQFKRNEKDRLTIMAHARELAASNKQLKTQGKVMAGQGYKS